MTLTIHLSDLIQILRELLNGIEIARQLHPASKAQEPAEELVADFHKCGNGEVFFIHLCVLNIFGAESLYHRVQQGEEAMQCHFG